MKFKFVIFILAVLVLFFSFSIYNAVASESVKFAVFSDPHVDFPGKCSQTVKMNLYSVEILEITIKSINETPDLDFAICLGDMTQDGEPWNMDKFIEIIKGLTIPCYIILGNHDQCVIPGAGYGSAPQGMSKNSIAGILEGHGFSGTGTWWSLDYSEDLHLIGLDTNVIGDWGGHISEEQFQWLEKDISSNSDRLTIVLGHHGIVPFCEYEKNPDWSKYYIDNGDKLVELFNKYRNVSFYLSGHRHFSTRYAEINGVYYIANPSTVSFPLRYTLYELTPEYLEYETVDVPVREEVRELAKSKLLKWGDSYLRYSNMADTEEGNKLFLDYYLSENSKKAKLPVRFYKNN